MRIVAILTIGLLLIFAMLALAIGMRPLLDGGWDLEKLEDPQGLAALAWIVILLAPIGYALLTGQRNRWFDSFFEGVPAWEILLRLTGLSLLVIVIVAIAIGLPGWVIGGSFILLLFLFVAWVVGKFNEHFNS